ncbi:MAG TPA: UBP-type zinc finger domain-containing protein [Anaerolineales bacterium]|nr:UBP-type zinc finger domain-containing protein [Anaerolineales bacterium]
MNKKIERKLPTGDALRKHIWSRGRDAKDCTHRDQIREVTPNSEGCQECLEMGDTWVHLRLCLTCGHVGCCNDSKNKHASRHFAKTKHPIVKPMEPGEDWLWCFADEVTLLLS